MNIDCCKSYIGKQIIGLLPGGAEECLYVLAINSQDYADTNFVGWTLNGNDFLTEIQNYVTAGTNYNNDQGGQSYYGYYLGTSPTELNITTNYSGEGLFTIRKVTDYEGASCDLVCYQASFDYGYQWRFIDFLNSILYPYYSPSAYDIDDASSLEYFLGPFLGPQISVTSVWNGSQYVVTINNAFNLGGFQLGDGGAVYTNFTALPCEIVPPEPVPLALLDAYGGAGAAYSVRKLSSSYTGSALRVRRSSDNTEQDIGFVGLDLDTTALSSFVGANNGFVTTWYDQSGNNRNMTNTTASQQPQIVTSGVVNLRNGDISIYFNNASSQHLSSTYLLTNGPISTFGVLNVDGTTSASRIGLFQSNKFEICKQVDTWGFQAVSDLAAVVTTSPSTVAYISQILPLTNGSSYLTYSNWNGNSNVVKYRRNGVAATSSGTSGSNLRTTNFAPFYYYKGYISEIIIYPTDQASNITGIETNINGYYNIYP